MAAGGGWVAVAPLGADAASDRARVVPGPPCPGRTVGVVVAAGLAGMVAVAVVRWRCVLRLCVWGARGVVVAVAVDVVVTVIVAVVVAVAVAVVAVAVVVVAIVVVAIAGGPLDLPPPCRGRVVAGVAPSRSTAMYERQSDAPGENTSAFALK